MASGNYGLKARGADHAMRLVAGVSGPTASIKYCPFCKNPAEGIAKFTFRKGRGGGKGAGLGFGGAATSKIAAHIRAEHPGEVDKADAAHAARLAAAVQGKD